MSPPRLTARKAALVRLHGPLNEIIWFDCFGIDGALVFPFAIYRQ
jgi:hypothetical protein